jgi:cell shape-determining protein MreC
MSKKECLRNKLMKFKKLNALNDLSATLATNYEHLLCKLKLLSKECDELKSKLESNESKQVIPLSMMNHLSLVLFLSPR